MQTLKLMETNQINNLTATIIDITDNITTNTIEDGKQLFNGVFNYTITLLRKHHYSIVVAKELAILCGIPEKTVQQLYQTNTKYDFYKEHGLGKLLAKQYNLTYVTAMTYQYELDKHFNNEFVNQKEYEKLNILRNIEEILIP